MTKTMGDSMAAKVDAFNTRLERRKTMHRIRLAGVPAVLLAALSLGLQGCATGVTADIPLTDVLADGLDELTVGDLVDSFAQFLTGQEGEVLGAVELGEIEALQAQLTEGTLDFDGFLSAVRGVTGDLAPNMAFGGQGFFGSPLGGRPNGDRAAALDLTDEQQVQAEAIFDQLHDDIAALREQAHEDIRGVLTEEQQALLDEQMADSGFGPLGPRFRRGPRGGDASRFGNRLTETLGLTEDQQAAVDQIREDLRATVRTLHEAARDAFRALLTDEQLTLLDEFEFRHDDDEADTDS